ncbi:MAG: hypothetical protein NC084_13620 [Bacteroides sp.]|nr:hypothetical protein [Eubacterium sp.]MCM1463735.1 hypothetical protein [Bacteroides sp.]
MKRIGLVLLLLTALLLSSGCRLYDPPEGEATTFEETTPQTTTPDTTTTTTKAETTTLKTTAALTENPVISSGFTELYQSAFLPLYDGMSVMTFAESEKIVNELIAKGYAAEIERPTDEDIGEIILSSPDGDLIKVYFGYDWRTDEDTISLLQYEHGDYFICASDNFHVSEVSFQIGDPTKDPKFYKAKNFAECERFMFGDGSSTVSEPSEYKILFGDLLEKTEIGTNLTIKVKITSALTKKSTVEQNYFNIEDIVKNQGGNKFKFIDYWAVADMIDGSEQKVVSFTVSEDVINKLYNEQITGLRLGDYVDDLYIHPGLQ